jgi:hypothetical protein
MPCSEILKSYLNPDMRNEFEAVTLIVRFDFSSQDVGRKG